MRDEKIKELKKYIEELKTIEILEANKKQKNFLSIELS